MDKKLSSFLVLAAIWNKGAMDYNYKNHNKGFDYMSGKKKNRRKIKSKTRR